MKILLKTILILDLLVINLFAVYFLYDKYFRTKGNDVELRPASNSLDSRFENCDLVCLSQIREDIKSLDEEVASLKGFFNDNLISPAPTSIINNSPQLVKNTQKFKNVTYVPIPGNGNVTNSNWTDISGTDFYLSKSDFVGLTGVYFEGNFGVQNGNGTGSLRIYDKTHSIAPVGGEISNTSQNSVFVTSGPVYLWEGNNHYVVQAKSSASDTVIFGSGRLKILTEN